MDGDCPPPRIYKINLKLKINFLNSCALQSSVPHQRAKVCGHRSYRCRDIELFAFFKLNLKYLPDGRASYGKTLSELEVTE